MAISLKDRARIKELAAELSQIVGGARRSDGSHKTFDEIESEAIEMTDLLAAEVMEQAVDAEPPEACRCPSCEGVGKLVDRDRQPIVLETDRGEVDWMTTEYFCRRCRRSFFPSAG
jgi:hypothetical protein